MKKSYNSRILNYEERHPNMTVVMKINYSPNSMNLWYRIKSKLGNGRKRKITIDNCNFNLKGNYSEADLINDIKDIHNEQFKHNNI